MTKKSRQARGGAATPPPPDTAPRRFRSEEERMLLSARCNAIADAATELSLLATAWTRRLTARQDPKHEIPQDVILALVSHAQDALDQIDRILIAQGMATDEVDGGA